MRACMASWHRRSLIVSTATFVYLGIYVKAVSSSPRRSTWPSSTHSADSLSTRLSSARFSRRRAENFRPQGPSCGDTAEPLSAKRLDLCAPAIRAIVNDRTWVGADSNRDQPRRPARLVNVNEGEVALPAGSVIRAWLLARSETTLPRGRRLRWLARRAHRPVRDVRRVSAAVNGNTAGSRRAALGVSPLRRKDCVP